MKPEDLTRAFLDVMINDTVQLGMTAARITNARHVFYTGGFVSHPFIQKLVRTEWLKIWAEKAALDKEVNTISMDTNLNFSYYNQLERTQNLGLLLESLSNGENYDYKHSTN